MEDQRAIALYTAFRMHRRNSQVASVMPMRDLLGSTAFGGPMLIFVECANDFLRELFNSVNDLGRLLNELSAWNRIFEENKADQGSLLIEHIRPLSTLALGAPQAIRGRVMYAALVCSSNANQLLYAERSDLKWDGKKSDMTAASRLGQPWEKWKFLPPFLNKGGLGYGAIHDLTSNFRNAHEHGHPRNVGLGLTTAAEQREITTFSEADGSGRPVGSLKRPMWVVTYRQPIPIPTVIKAVAEQHALARGAYDALGDLLQEQCDALLLKTHPAPWTLPRQLSQKQASTEAPEAGSGSE